MPFLVPGLTAVLTAAAWVAVSAPTSAAPRLGVPTKFMQGDRYRSAIVEVAERVKEGRVRLRILERLAGESPDELTVRGGEGLLEPGKVYIVGHTDKPSRRSYRWDTDPEGPRVLSVPAVGPAVFQDSEAMRTLLRERAADEPLTDRRRLEAVLDQLGRPDVQARRFVLLELALDPVLRELMDESEISLLRETLESGALEPMAHDYLLQAALPLVEGRQGDWLAQDCRKLVASHGPRLELSSWIPSLLITALGTLERIGVAADFDVIHGHVGSNNPGVGKAAFQAMAALDPRRAAGLAPTYIDAEGVHPDTRRFIARLSTDLAGDRTE